MHMKFFAVISSLVSFIHEICSKQKSFCAILLKPLIISVIELLILFAAWQENVIVLGKMHHRLSLLHHDNHILYLSMCFFSLTTVSNFVYLRTCIDMLMIQPSPQSIQKLLLLGKINIDFVLSFIHFNKYAVVNCNAVCNCYETICASVWSCLQRNPKLRIPRPDFRKILWLL